ncbi:MAG TPA: EF-hand domain-containing protein [Aromatoleum sp.]|uniref:EF-hand domain-containing protein n=1 Tax=Aromatoleum sp. TaxID=2307007 RepID=UPI002B49C814|nr:EF-hand domain-containing protein [Aromatoleum sp.]HJV28605.1 EF-hand domain-containing protein [Aromatoleum sp.]
MKTALSIVALVLAGALPLGASAADATKSAPAMGTGSTTPSPTTPAELGKPEVPPMFKELDTNRDGQISRDEAKRSAEILSTFDSLDTDHNGKVSLLEWNAAEMQKPRPKQ